MFCHPNKLYFIVLDRISSISFKKNIFNNLTIFNSSNLGVVYSGYRKLNCCKWKEMLDYLSWWSLDLISVVSGLLSGGWERWRNYKHSSTSFSTIYQIFVIHRAQQPALAVYLRSCVNHYTTTLISWNLISEVVQVQRWWNINVSLTRPRKMSFNKDGKTVEEEAKVHRIRITLTSKNVAPLEKVKTLNKRISGK